jgi:DNA replication protein DnaC
VTAAAQTEAARLPLMLAELRLPTVHRLWPEFAERADKEGWPAARFLATLVEHELAERVTRRIERHRLESRLPPEKTLATFDFAAVPRVRKAHILALAAGDAWLEKGANILVFGPPGTGKSHLASALGHALVDNGYRVLFSRTGDLVQRLQAARRELALPAALAKLDRFDLLVLDDLSYVRKDQAETSVLFELIAERYERRSLLITARWGWTTRRLRHPQFQPTSRRHLSGLGKLLLVGIIPTRSALAGYEPSLVRCWRWRGCGR